MGLLKAAFMRAAELGLELSRSDKPVCAECIEDEALAEVVAASAESNVCSYCGRRSEAAFATPLDVVTDHMAVCINRVYTDPAEVLPYESAEGGYQGPMLELWEVLEETGFEVANTELMENVTSSFQRFYWAERDWQVLSPSDRYLDGWEDFKKVVKHRRRYTFWSDIDESERERDPDYIPAGEMLGMIAAFVRGADVIVKLPMGSRIWRVRVHDVGEILKNDSDFTAPPAEKATQPNRMSPAGVPMFYGAQDSETAKLEMLDPSRSAGKAVTGACFETMIPLTILDLTDLPPIPSFFDEEQADRRASLIFLHGFTADLAKPISRDGREHIEYVPTQAFTEYVRWEMQSESGGRIDGIRYRSSKNEKPCFVLFCEQDECIDNPRFMPTRRWMRFLPTSLTTQSLA